MQLREMCCITMGQSPNSDSYNEEREGVPFFQGNADFGERYPNVRTWCKEPKKMAKNGDVLISVRAPIGAINYAREICCIGRGLAALSPKTDKVSKEFIFWVMKSRCKELQMKGTGSTFKAISKKILEEVKIPLYPLEKQIEYSLVLEKVYAIIETYKSELQKLDELIQARFVELFGDPTINTKKYPLKLLPEIAEYWNGLTYKPDDVADKGTIVLRSSNIQNMTLDFEDIVRVNCKIGEKKYVHENDILMCSRNGSARLVGKVALIKNIEEPMSFGAFMLIIRSAYYPYLLTYFQMPAFRAQIVTGATTTINQITGRMLDNVKLPVPDMYVINQFADFVNQVHKSKVEIQQALEKTQLLFDSLMQQYFR